MTENKNFNYESLKSKNGARSREKNVAKKFPEEYQKILKFKDENKFDFSFQQVLYLYLHQLENPPKCCMDGCDKPLNFESFNYGYKGKYCSIECSSKSEERYENMRKTNLERYGTEYSIAADSTRDKIKKTILEKYGVENIMDLPETYEKIKETVKERYGVENAMQLQKFKDQAMETNKKNHGGIFTLNLPKSREKRNNIAEENFLERYNDIEFINHRGNTVSFLCGCDNKNVVELNRATFRFRYNNNIGLCTKCNPIDNSSYGEKTLQNFVEEIYDDEIIFNDRKILSGKELDVLIPNKFLAIEYDGLYWHSDAKVSPTYHLEKTEICKLHDITLIHIFEDEWINKSNVVKSIIKNKLGLLTNRIFARKTTIKKVKSNIARKFLDENHIQGHCNSSVKLGLYYEKQLVALMTFGGLRKSLGSKSKKDHYEMLRFASKLDTIVVGGASKLFNHFIKNYNPKYICSYANRRYFDGAMYENLGLSFIKKTEPNYFYVKKSGDLYMRENRYKYRKSELVKEGFDPEKSERQIMQDRGFLRIYDCGTYKYEKYYN